MAAALLPACALGLSIRSGRELAPALTVLLIPKEPEESTAFFRFQVMKTQDPRDVYERALAFLQADYFQEPETFSDRMVTVLPRAPRLQPRCSMNGCVLEFVAVETKLSHCPEVRALRIRTCRSRGSDLAQSPVQSRLPDNVHVLGFKPDWTSADAR